MFETSIKFYNKKEADEVIKRHPDKKLKKRQLILSIEDDPRCKGAKKAKCGYIILENVRYPTVSVNDVAKYCFGEKYYISDGFEWGCGTKIFFEDI